MTSLKQIEANRLVFRSYRFPPQSISESDGACGAKYWTSVDPVAEMCQCSEHLRAH